MPHSVQFVGFPPKTKQTDVFTAVSEYGYVTRFSSMFKEETFLFEGIVFVDFINKEALSNALKDETLSEKNIVVCRYNKRSISSNSLSLQQESKTKTLLKTIFFKGFPLWAKSNSFFEVACKYGPILDLIIPHDRATNLPKGIMFVEYVDQRSAIGALNDNNKMFVGEDKIEMRRSNTVTKENRRYKRKLSENQIESEPSPSNEIKIQVIKT